MQGPHLLEMRILTMRREREQERHILAVKDQVMVINYGRWKIKAVGIREENQGDVCIILLLLVPCFLI